MKKLKTSTAYARQVFLNCPFDAGYRSIYEAIIFAVIHCGFVLRCAREREDSGETRIAKIVEIIRDSQFGIHDISRVELDETTDLPRFNMPLELGLFLGAKSFSDAPKQKKKRCLILDSAPYRYQKFISDIAGQDIRSHDGEAKTAMNLTRDWLATVSKRSLPGPVETERLYDEFRRDLPAILAKLALRPDVRFPVTTCHADASAGFLDQSGPGERLGVVLVYWHGGGWRSAAYFFKLGGGIGTGPADFPVKRDIHRGVVPEEFA